MKNIGFNENELRKTIITKIDKDGFHERTVTYGKDSGSESGDGNFSTATVTIVNNTSDNNTNDPVFDFRFHCPAVVEASGRFPACVGDYYTDQIHPEETVTVESAVLYKGILFVDLELAFDSTSGELNRFVFTATGDVEQEGLRLLISGDCTITISDDPNYTQG